MLYVSFVFLSLAGICAYLGFWEIPGSSATVAQILFIFFFALFMLSLMVKGFRSKSLQ